MTVSAGLTASNSPPSGDTALPDERGEGAGFQALSVLTSKLRPNFTWQDVVFCLIQKKIVLLAEEAASLGMHCDDSEGIWGTEGGG